MLNALLKGCPRGSAPVSNLDRGAAYPGTARLQNAVAGRLGPGSITVALLTFHIAMQSAPEIEVVK